MVKADNKSPVLFVMAKEKILRMHPEAVGLTTVSKISLARVSLVGDTAWDWSSQTLYVSDIEEGVILAVDVVNDRVREIAKSSIAAEGLEFDHLGRNVYWIDSSMGTVEASTDDGATRIALVRDLERPIDLLLYPERGLMFVAVLGKQPHVAMFDMLGRNGSDIITDIGLPSSLVLDRWTDSLLCADALYGIIKSLSLKESPGRIVTYRGGVGRAISIAVSNKFIYWTDYDNRSIFFVSKNSSSDRINIIPLPEVQNVTSMLKLSFVDPRELGENQCSQNKSGCSHMCITVPTGHTCACPGNMTLHTDGKTCKKPEAPTCGPGQRPCADGRRCIPQDGWCNRTFECDDRSDERSCGTTCPEGDFRCRNGRCVFSSWKCDRRDDCGDNSDEEDCPVSDNKEICDAIQSYSCGHDQCIPRSWLCDGDKDCDDGSDEIDCDHNICRPNEFRCGNGQCLSLQWKCDGEMDCPDGMDEEDCGTAAQVCKSEEFSCQDGMCIDVKFVCDRKTDCVDGSDEKNCGTAAQACKSEEFSCQDGMCVDVKFVCDRKNDCADGSDEKNCGYTKPTCRPGLFRCEDGKCIDERDVCDGYSDCLGEEDEKNCTNECKRFEFYCSSNSHCIPISWLCDGAADCEDGADEALPHCVPPTEETTTPLETTPTSTIEPEKFLCQSGEYLDWNKVCDGKRDCLDFSDEGSNCKTSCNIQNGKCSQGCRDTSEGPQCFCFEGFYLLPDGNTCEDINECEEVLGLCSHFCNNTNGSFKCSCASGYYLDSNRQTCKVNNSGPASLLFLLPDEIKSINLRTYSEHLVIRINHTDMRSMDFDSKEGVIFWSGLRGQINSFYPGTNKLGSVIPTHATTKHLAWDWVSQNLYYTDKRGNIWVCSRKLRQCAIVVSDGDDIKGLTLSPDNGFLFWSVWSSSIRLPGYIQRNEMDGSNGLPIVSKKTHWPTGLAVDHIVQRLYWTDTRLNVLESVDFSGQKRKLIVYKGLAHAYTLALFEDNVYWSDWGSNTIYMVNKFTGEGKIPVGHGNVKTRVLKVVHEVSQPEGSNHCFNNDCEHLCVLRVDNYSCLCAPGYTLANDDQSCIHIETTTQNESAATHHSIGECTDTFCLPVGECVILRTGPFCRCPYPYYGPRCELQFESTKSVYDYSYVVMFLLGIGTAVAVVMVSLACRATLQSRRNKKLRTSISIGFCFPLLRVRRIGNLTIDEDDDGVSNSSRVTTRGIYRYSSRYVHPRLQLNSSITKMTSTPRSGRVVRVPSPAFNFKTRREVFIHKASKM